VSLRREARPQIIILAVVVGGIGANRENAARAIVLARRLQRHRPRSLGAGREITIRDLVLGVRLTGFRGEILSDPSKPNGQPRCRLDVSRADRKSNFRAAAGFEEGPGERSSGTSRRAGQVPSPALVVTDQANSMDRPVTEPGGRAFFSQTARVDRITAGRRRPRDSQEFGGRSDERY
jgi:hypothetical protein